MEGRSSSSKTTTTDRRPAAESKTPSRICWVILSIILFFTIVGISVVGALSFAQSTAKPLLQIARLTFQDQQGSLVNQTAVVDQSRSTITYYVTSPSNRTAVVLFDSQNGYVCYKPAEQSACFLRRMDHQDLENIQLSFNASVHRDDPRLLQNNQTKYVQEFLGIVAVAPVDPAGVGEAVRALCELGSIYWVRKGDGRASSPHLEQMPSTDESPQPVRSRPLCSGPTRASAVGALRESSAGTAKIKFH
ncbi:BRICHOS domain-containing protein 5 isoform X1 [Alligator sinensis]|uniref:BRICHOS domain-containing protein 5 isoform X1 n=1 Tax=Alligator sinensis TaxID=38654 RepID=A0A1U7RPU2_ALLSI|nr:BRICHOS domain-containing protein 5 isoform X1 [Alligator sinensis]